MFDTYDPQETAASEYTPDPDRENFYPKNLVGHTIILWVNAHIRNAPGGMKEDSDAIDVTIVDLDRASLDNSHWGRPCINIWWRAGSLIKNLKGRIGRPPIIVHLTEGTPEQRGWRPPFILTDVSADPGVAAKAQAWAQWNPAFVPDLRASEFSNGSASSAASAPPLPPSPQPTRSPTVPPQTLSTPVGTPTPTASMTTLTEVRPGSSTGAPLPPVPPGVPASQMSPSVQPTLPPPPPSPEAAAAALDRFAQVHPNNDAARNATLESLRQKHHANEAAGIPDVPPF